ncbi:uncharacterized protein METZ01_LOCUS58873, partial [marine metagenome]
MILTAGYNVYPAEVSSGVRLGPGLEHGREV